MAEEQTTEEGFTPPSKSLMQQLRDIQSNQNKEEAEKTPEQTPTEDPVEDTPPHTSEDAVKESLKAFLYDQSLVDEYSSAFMAVKDAESLSKIMEVLNAKEQEIANLLKHKDAFKQSSNPDAKQVKEPDTKTDINYVDQILAEKYGAK